MKRIIITFAAVVLASVASAQMLFTRSTDIEFPRLVADTVAVQDSAALADSLWWERQPRVSLQIGLSAGVMLYGNDNQFSPYYSTHGLVLEVPVMLEWRVSPHWRLSTGLEFDFHFNPLHYNVDLHWVDDGNGFRYADGLDFASTTNSKQHFYTYFGYIGIPLQATWYPWHHERRVLALSADIFAGRTIARTFCQNRSYAERDGSGAGIDDVRQSIHNAESLLPWKLELGLSVTTDVIGLLHGVRFFVNLLPSYHDPVTDTDLFLHGMTLYL